MTQRGVFRALLGLVGLCAALHGVSACGAPPTSSKPRPVVSLPPPAPEPSLPPAPPDAKAEMLVAAAKKAFAALPGYRADMRYFQKNGTRTTSGLYALTGKPLRHLRIDITEGTGKGTKLLWHGGDSVKARPGGLLSPIVVTLPLSDERLVSVRGYTLAETNIASLLDMMADPRNRLSYAGKSGNNDVVTAAGRHILGGCSKMTAHLDAASLMPVGVDATDGREVVFKVRLQGFRKDPKVHLDI